MMVLVIRLKQSSTEAVTTIAATIHIRLHQGAIHPTQVRQAAALQVHPEAVAAAAGVQLVRAEVAIKS